MLYVDYNLNFFKVDKEGKHLFSTSFIYSIIFIVLRAYNNNLRYGETQNLKGFKFIQFGLGTF